jgi:hypothetical protein
MDSHTIEITTKASLTEMRAHLESAADIANVAEAFAVSGNVERGIEIALDVEEIIYKVNTFLITASMIKRLGQDLTE